MQKYVELLRRYSDLKQYSITFPGDYSEQIALDAGKVMNMHEAKKEHLTLTRTQSSTRRSRPKIPG